MIITPVVRARPGPTAAALLLAPAGVLTGWTIMRLGGSRSTGAGWVAAHAVWILGWGLFALVIAELWRRARGSRRATVVATAGAVVAAAGLLAVLGQMIVDIAVGVAASDRDGMRELFERAFRIPGVQAVLYGAGPVLLIAGLVALFVQLAVLRRIRAGVAVLAVLGMLLMTLDTAVGSTARLVVMPAGLLCLWLSLTALRLERVVR
ncbi:hypothetical protein [Actinoplanes sp. NPDC020271]|uniref:hypothetical protein n=1 Tax=Actinoplanes sp. NPDC020271 TaxID=3363896 RepID=UPI0037B1E48F